MTITEEQLSYVAYFYLLLGFITGVCSVFLHNRIKAIKEKQC